MDYIADHYNMDLALAWALRLEGKADQEKFKELGWGLRTWDQWNFNECDERFGDDWPGRIPAQLVARTLFYFTKTGDLVVPGAPVTYSIGQRSRQARTMPAVIIPVPPVRSATTCSGPSPSLGTSSW